MMILIAGSKSRRAANAARSVALAALSVGLVAPAAHAQDVEAKRWEVGVFSGGFFGSRIALDPSADARISSGASFGLRGAFALNSRFRLEASFSRASVRLVTVDPVTGQRLGPDAHEHVNTYELDGLYGFGRGRLRGYFELGAGAMSLPETGQIAAAGGDTRFTANVGLGVEYLLSDNLGLRLDGRYRWRDSGRRLGGVRCEGEVCGEEFSTNLFSSAEVNAGMTYRFGGLDAPAAGPNALAAGDSYGEPPVPRRFGTAAAEVFLLDLVSWTFDRYILDDDFADVTSSGVKENFRTGFTYDRDLFVTNQLAHPLDGGRYFNAARTNGFNFWESGVAAFAGSFLWECCAEIEPPAINDLVNTTVGGMVMGEVDYRLASMLWNDTREDGSLPLWQRLTAIVLNPIGAINRLLYGESATGPPEQSQPSSFHAEVAAGYRHLGDGADEANQALLSLRADYGDAFAGEIEKPFDSFSLGIDLNVPAEFPISRFEERGILKGWELSDSHAPARHILGISLGYEYRNDEVVSFGSEVVAVGLRSRYALGHDLYAESGVGADVFPLAAIRTTDAVDPTSGRNYDYASGGGLSVDGRLLNAGREIASLAYRVAWTATADGPSTTNTLQWFRASGVVPVGRAFGLGASYSWYQRRTSYLAAAPQRRSQSDWRVFVSRWL